MTITRDEAKQQVSENYDAFVELLPGLMEKHLGQWALLRDKKLIEFYPTMAEAYRAGIDKYPDHRFSAQEVCEQTPVIMGGFSYVL